MLNNHNNTRKFIDNLSNQSSTNSSGFHSKSTNTTTTTTTFNNEYSPRIAEMTDYSFSGKKKYRNASREKKFLSQTNIIKFTKKYLNRQFSFRHFSIIHTTIPNECVMF